MAKGFLSNVGVVETISVLVANGDTSKSVAVDDRGDGNYKVFIGANYESKAYATAKTRAGFTLNFADPLADKVIDVLIVG